MNTRTSKSRSRARRELLATSMLAGLALDPASLAFAQSAPPAGGGLALPEVVAASGEGGAGSAQRQGGGRFTGYSVPNATSATKTNTPILQTPVAIQVVPRETMDDQQAITVQDAIVSNVSSVSAATFTLPFETFTIRGFSTGNNVYMNSLRVPNNIGIETQNLQAIEVLKGPSAMLYGRVEAGGLVNLVLKRPLETPYYSFQEQAGAYGLTRTTVDVTGPLTADRTWLYRINGDFERNNSFRHFVSSQNMFIAPTITYHPIEQFRLNFDAQFQHKTAVDDTFGNVAFGARPAPIPITRYLQDPSITANKPFRMDRRYIGYDWTFDISPNWSVTNRLYYQNQGWTLSQTALTALSATGIATRILRYGDFSQDTIASNLDLKGKFDTGPLQHAVLIGADYFSNVQPLAGSLFQIPVSTVNIFNPVYNGTGLPNRVNNNFLRNSDLWKGIYAQDMISTANDSLHLLVGGRYDSAQTGASFVIAGPACNPLPGPACADARFRTRDASAFSPRVGVLYQPQPWLSFYGNFAQSFGTNTGTSADGSPLAPTLATQWEGGVKAEFFDRRLLATLAFYDITKTNVATPDPLVPGTTILIGAAQSKGAEFDLTGRVNENWSLIANFSHDDARVTKGSPYNPLTEITTQLAIAGFRLASVPLNQGNLWVKYDADQDFRGLSVAGGLNVVGSAYGDNANSFQIPQYTLVNGMVSYRFAWQGAHITAQLNVKNILNTTYYPAAANRFVIAVGAPRTILASLRVEF